MSGDQVYQFKIMARSIVGYSEESSAVSIRSAKVPDQPDAPTTTISGDNVVIDWTAPSNGGSPLTAYVILIKQADNSFSEDLLNCNGLSETVLNSAQCTIPISSLRTTPYNLDWGSSIYAVVKATNAVGDS